MAGFVLWFDRFPWNLLLVLLLLAMALVLTRRLLLPLPTLTINSNEIRYQRQAHPLGRAMDRRYGQKIVTGVHVTKQGFFGYGVGVRVSGDEKKKVRTALRMFGKVPSAEDVTASLREHGYVVLSQREWAKTGTPT